MAIVSTKKSGRNVVALFSLETDKERNAYRNLLSSDCPNCPMCGAQLNPNDRDMRIKVVNPVKSGMFDMDLGEPVTTCQSCGNQFEVRTHLGAIDMKCEVDITAFPSVMRIIELSRRQYEAAKRKAALMRLNDRRGR